MSQKLTRDTRKRIEAALYHVQRAERFLRGESVAVARRSHGTTSLDYVRADGKALYEIDKHIGSDLCGLDDSIRALSQLLEVSQ